MHLLTNQKKKIPVFHVTLPCYAPNIITLELFISHKIKMSERDENKKEQERERERDRGRQRQRKACTVLATHRSQQSVARLNYQTLNEKLWSVILTNIQILY